jgi:hypothetical protein
LEEADSESTHGKYMSHNVLTGEVYLDGINIDFLRYFKLKNFLLASIGSIIGIVLMITYSEFIDLFTTININSLYLIHIVGGVFWFLFTATIAYYAVQSEKGAARIAGRRGLFTFSVMLVIALVGLMWSGMIKLDQEFFYFVKYLLIALIFEGIFAVPLDYGVTFISGIFKKKRFDRI